jgi:hypothetical protein
MLHVKEDQVHPIGFSDDPHPPCCHACTRLGLSHPFHCRREVVVGTALSEPQQSSKRSNGQTDRRAGGQAGRQADRQTDRQTDTLHPHGQVCMSR